jgi:hypothetical protein
VSFDIVSFLIGIATAGVGFWLCSQIIATAEKTVDPPRSVLGESAWSDE